MYGRRLLPQHCVWTLLREVRPQDLNLTLTLPRTPDPPNPTSSCWPFLAAGEGPEHFLPGGAAARHGCATHSPSPWSSFSCISLGWFWELCSCHCIWEVTMGEGQDSGSRPGQQDLRVRSTLGGSLSAAAGKGASFNAKSCLRLLPPLPLCSQKCCVFFPPYPFAPFSIFIHSFTCSFPSFILGLPEGGSENGWGAPGSCVTKLG